MPDSPDNTRRASLETELAYAGRRRQQVLAVMSDLRADAVNAQVIADGLNDAANALADIASDLRALEDKIQDQLQPYDTRDYNRDMRSQVPGSYGG